jgi:hypothetical protein
MPRFCDIFNLFLQRITPVYPTYHFPPHCTYCSCCVRAVLSYFLLARHPSLSHGLLIYEISRSHTTTQYSRQDCTGRVISSCQRPLPDNTQQSETDIHASGGIRTHNFSRRAAADLSPRPCEHWYR